jgi:PIN domain nuclease of toxin-antitoxin system
MSFWETTMLSDRGRITIHEDPSSWRQKVLRLGISEIPITGDIAIAAARLTEFHGDPADRLITATAIVNGATLVTADRRILKWRSPLRRIDASR